MNGNYETISYHKLFGINFISLNPPSYGLWKRSNNFGKHPRSDPSHQSTVHSIRQSHLELILIFARKYSNTEAMGATFLLFFVRPALDFPRADLFLRTLPSLRFEGTFWLAIRLISNGDFERFYNTTATATATTCEYFYSQMRLRNVLHLTGPSKECQFPMTTTGKIRDDVHRNLSRSILGALSDRPLRTQSTW